MLFTILIPETKGKTLEELNFTDIPEQPQQRTAEQESYMTENILNRFRTYDLVIENVNTV